MKSNQSLIQRERISITKSLGVMLGAGVLATVALLPQARGELVFDNNQAQAVPAAAARGDDRVQLRDVIETSQKAQATVQSGQHVVEPAVQPVAQISQPAPAAATVELQNLSKSELMRRERVREELKNEDILQERLEALRLQDEQRRTNQLLGTAPTGEVPVAPAPTGPMKNEVVVAPITDTPGHPAAAPTGVIGATGAMQDQVTMSHASATTSLDGEPATKISIAPRFGVSNMNGNSGYNVQSRFTGGVGLGVEVSDNMTFEAGYQYSEYGVAMSSTNPYVVQAQLMTGTYGPNFETQVMKQNVMDAGLKFHVLGPDAKLRPFVGGGAAYSRSFINYDSRIISLYNQGNVTQPWAQDYEVSSFLGYLSTGLDVKLGKSVTIGALFKYYTVLSARENQGINNGTFSGYTPGLYGGYGGYNPYGLSAYGAAAVDPEKQALGGSLAR